MKEREIIEAIKNNKKELTAFRYMKKELRDYILDHFRVLPLYQASVESGWHKIDTEKVDCIYFDDAYTLDKDYKPPLSEDEIIEYLIENKTKGIAFGFMPHEVKNWCLNYVNWKTLYRFVDRDNWREEGKWVSCADDGFFNCVSLKEIVCLVDKDCQK